MQKRAIQIEEERIISMLDNNVPFAKAAFGRMYARFEENDAMDSACHAAIIRTIYIVRRETVIWKIARDHNVGERTLYRYRKTYMKWYYFYINWISAAGDVA